MSEDTESDRSELANRLYKALQSTGRLDDHREITYRCRNKKRCLLMDVIATPEGRLFHHPRYKNSTELNERASSADGRRANTIDGERHWKARTYFEEVAAINHTLKCDHTPAPSFVIDVADVVADIAAGRREVSLPRTIHEHDGTQR